MGTEHWIVENDFLHKELDRKNAEIAKLKATQHAIKEALIEIDAVAFGVMQDDVAPYGATISCGWLHEKVEKALELIRQEEENGK